MVRGTTTTTESGGSENLVAAFTGGGWCFLRIWREALAIDYYDVEGNMRYREVLRPEDNPARR